MCGWGKIGSGSGRYKLLGIIPAFRMQWGKNNKIKAQQEGTGKSCYSERH